MEKPSLQSGESEPPQTAPQPVCDFLSWLTWPGILLAVYVLSTGPAAKAVRKFDWETKHPDLIKAVDIFYAPVQFAYDRSSIANDLLDWYLQTLWKVDE